MDFGAIELPLVLRVEAVALGQEVLQRSSLGRSRPAGRTIRTLEPCARALALVVDPVGACPPRHARVVVRQAIQPPRRLHEEPALRVEAEEPDAGLVAVR